jgi:hypothetical protein
MSSSLLGYLLSLLIIESWVGEYATRICCGGAGFRGFGG